MTARRLMPGLRFPGAADDPEPALRLAARGVAGFCVFDGDARLPGLLAQLQAAAPHPLLFASDLESGGAQHVPGAPQHPPAVALDSESAALAGWATARAARAAGVTMTFAPVCDVVEDPDHPILGTRGFTDPVNAAPAFVRGARDGGLRCCAKHFPGHGAARGDSHDELPSVTDDEGVWRERDAPPFRACVEAGVDAVMTAHVAWPALTGEGELPATLSRRVLRDLLRRELGFQGLVVTDALLMAGVLQGRSEAEAARAAVEAGCDLILVPEDVEGVLLALQGTEEDASLERIRRASVPLTGWIHQVAAASLHAAGSFPLSRGPHPLQWVDLHGDRPDVAGLFATRLDVDYRDGEGRLVREFRGRGGLAVPGVAVARRVRAWGGPRRLPGGLAPEGGWGLAIGLGPPALLDGLEAEARVQAPGEDPATIEAVLNRVLGA